MNGLGGQKNMEFVDDGVNWWWWQNLAWVALIGGVKEPPKSCIWEYWTIKDGKERKLKLPSEERDMHQNKQSNCSIIMILQSVSQSIGSCTAACRSPPSWVLKITSYISSAETWFLVEIKSGKCSGLNQWAQYKVRKKSSEVRSIQRNSNLTVLWHLGSFDTS